MNNFPKFHCSVCSFLSNKLILNFRSVRYFSTTKSIFQYLYFVLWKIVHIFTKCPFLHLSFKQNKQRDFWSIFSKLSEIFGLSCIFCTIYLFSSTRFIQVNPGFCLVWVIFADCIFIRNILYLLPTLSSGNSRNLSIHLFLQYVSVIMYNNSTLIQLFVLYCFSHITICNCMKTSSFHIL